MPKVALSHRRLAILALSGWVLAFIFAVPLLIWTIRRVKAQLPFVQQQRFTKLLASRKAELASQSWRDRRPLRVFAGDSQIELGNWYDLFMGEYAIRNCSLSAATIHDVTYFLSALPDHGLETVVLMCGINSLGRGETVAECIQRYQELLLTCQSLAPKHIVVLSVLPVSLSRGNQGLNERVKLFNRSLEQLCHTHAGVSFLDVRAPLVHDDALADEVTSDGLHLNGLGYQIISEVIRTNLAKLSESQ
jgi:lysophospholipase L1-like esterase